MSFKPGVPDLRPVRNWATQQEVRGGRVTEASSLFTAAPHRLHYLLPELCLLSPVRSMAAIINEMSLSYPEATSHPWSMEKLSSMKLVPGAKKVGHC